jgi:nucleotide-binding universal stress UspA family protein
MFVKMRIIVGVDGSVQSKKALAEAITIAKSYSAFVKAISVHDKGTKEKAESAIGEAAKEMAKAGVTYDTSLIQSSNPAKALATLAKQESFDLIVVGSRGLGGRVSVLLGSVSKEVVGHAYCNVLVVKK